MYCNASKTKFLKYQVINPEGHQTDSNSLKQVPPNSRGETPALPVSLTPAPSGFASPVNPSLVNQGERHNQQLNDSQMAPAFHELCLQVRVCLGLDSMSYPRVMRRCFCIPCKLPGLTVLTGCPSPTLREESPVLQHPVVGQTQSGLSDHSNKQAPFLPSTQISQR